MCENEPTNCIQCANLENRLDIVPVELGIIIIINFYRIVCSVPKNANHGIFYSLYIY